TTGRDGFGRGGNPSLGHRAVPAANPPTNGGAHRFGTFGWLGLPRCIQARNRRGDRVRRPPGPRRVPRGSAGEKRRPVSSTMGRAALIVSGGILLSRVLGFAREVALAGLLGRSIEADLYQHAFAIPDFLFFLMAGGYLTITFVPIISRHLAEGNPQEANRSFTAVLKVVGGAMLVVTAITFILARPIAEKVFAEVSADHMDDLVRLIRIILPAQFFFVIGSLLMAVQYAHRRFVIPTLAPLIYNVGIIAGGLISWGMGTPSPDGFVWGALVGAVLGNFGLQIWGARRLGLQVVPQTSLRHPAIPEYFALALPLMIGQSAVGLDEVFFRIFGQFAEVGNTAALGYARRINMVPIGVIAQAAGVASYPFLARLFAEGDLAGWREWGQQERSPCHCRWCRWRSSAALSRRKTRS